MATGDGQLPCDQRPSNECVGVSELDDLNGDPFKSPLAHNEDRRIGGAWADDSRHGHRKQCGRLLREMDFRGHARCEAAVLIESDEHGKQMADPIGRLTERHDGSLQVALEQRKADANAVPNTQGGPCRLGQLDLDLKLVVPDEGDDRGSGRNYLTRLEVDGRYDAVKWRANLRLAQQSSLLGNRGLGGFLSRGERLDRRCFGIAVGGWQRALGVKALRSAEV